jgi:phosphate transport system protein
MPSELRVDYHRQLQTTEDRLLEAAYRVAELMPRVSRAWTQGDTTIVDEASSLRDGVAEDCERVEDEAFRLFALQTPVAGELRTLVALLRLVTHVDRASALLAHVASSIGQMPTDELPEAVRDIVQELAERSTEVLRLGLDAWRTRDAEALPGVIGSDESVDTLQVTLLESARGGEMSNEALVGLGLLARYYERIADHGVAFARDVVFVVTGRRARED